MPRPAHLDLGGNHQDAFQPPRTFVMRDMPSPRAGEVPPALSPLDAFAMQSRMLAQRFQQEGENGRRMSRLPHNMVAQEIGNRPGYFRSISGDGRMSDVEEETSPVAQNRGTQSISEASTSRDRPVSHYPRFSNATVQSEDVPAVPTPFYDAMENPQMSDSKQGNPDYFGLGVARAASPEQDDRGLVNVQAPSPNDYPSLTNSIDTISSHPRTMTNDSQRSQRSQTSERVFNLAPPQSPRYPRSPRSFQSIRSVHPDSGDDDVHSTSGSHPLSSARKFSGSSGMSRPHSPFSPWMHPVHRSPSMTSEYSIGGAQQPPRPTANFSRPMSSAGSRPSFDTRNSFDNRPSFDSRSSLEQTRPAPPIRQISGASSSTEQSSKSAKSALSRQYSADGAESFPPLDPPTQIEDPERVPTPNSPSSYIYAKYKLPRTKQASRDSQAFRDSWIQKQFEWDRTHEHESQHERTQSDAMTSNMHASPAFSDTARIGRSLTPLSSEARSQSADPRGADRADSFHRSSPSVKTISTDRTVKARPLHQKSASADLTADEHLELGINCQLAKQDQKSTYHFRLAAIAGLPAGMLLYGLACQHGWGMRCVPEQGVMWLRKAVEAIGLDVAEAEEKLGSSRLDPADRRIRKTRYACGLYQLGMSAYEGNGCPKDRILALRYFEIAAGWGDADALEMAGNCYARGEGCKKDQRKAASLLRKAAEKGQYSAGNSWIYKDKYMDDEPTTSNNNNNNSSSTTSFDKEHRRPDTAVSRDGRGREDRSGGSRARSRSLWGRSRKEKPPLSPALPPPA